jgi:hypothetical protein
MSVDKTAEAILEADSKMDVFIPTKAALIGNQYRKIADLKAMARLWLMRGEIVRGFEEVENWFIVDQLSDEALTKEDK